MMLLSWLVFNWYISVDTTPKVIFGDTFVGDDDVHGDAILMAFL